MSTPLLHPHPPSPFGVWLDERRCELRLSVRDLATALRISRTELGDCLRGASAVLPRRTWAHLSYRLDVPYPLVQQIAESSVEPVVWH